LNFLLGLSFCLPITAIALPGQSPPKGSPPSRDPFSNASWPLPNRAFGDPNGWGGEHIHDPSLIQTPAGFFSFGTHDGLTIGHSPTLTGYWSHIGSVLGNSSIIDNSGSIDPWAPDVHKVGDTYYCFYAVSTFGTQNSSVGLATSHAPLPLPGTWVDHGAIFSSGADLTTPFNISNAIDPNLFIDPVTHVPYLNYGSFWSDIWQLQLTPNLLSLFPDAGSKATFLSQDPSGTRPEEGAYMTFRDFGPGPGDDKGKWYYLYYSHGICCGYNASALPAPGTEYSIRLGRSRSANGPFVDMDDTDLTVGGGYEIFGSHDWVYGPGGQGVLTLADGRDVLYYHFVDTRVSYLDEEKFLGWNFLEYIDGWPVAVAGSV